MTEKEDSVSIAYGPKQHCHTLSNIGGSHSLWSRFGSAGRSSTHSCNPLALGWTWRRDLGVDGGDVGVQCLSSPMSAAALHSSWDRDGYRFDSAPRRNSVELRKVRFVDIYERADRRHPQPCSCYPSLSLRSTARNTLLDGIVN